MISSICGWKSSMRSTHVRSHQIKVWVHTAVWWRFRPDTYSCTYMQADWQRGHAAMAVAYIASARGSHARDLKRFRARASHRSVGASRKAQRYKKPARGGYMRHSARTRKIFAFGAHSPKSASPVLQLSPHRIRTHSVTSCGLGVLI